MMKILGIDTSSKVLAVAFAENGVLMWQRNLTHTFRHLEQLFVLMDDGLKKLKWTYADIDVIACGLGPGSFTGLRIGLSAVKGLAVSSNTRVVGVSSLDVIARNCRYPFPGAVLLDARRGKLYSRFIDEEGTPCSDKDSVDSIDGVIKELCRGKQKVWVAGDANIKYKELFQRELGNRLVIAPEKCWYPSAKHVMLCAEHNITHKQFLSIDAIIPRYLRLSEAEEMLKKKKRQRNDA